MKYGHIIKNLRSVKSEIDEILEKSGREPGSCELLVVTKTRDADEIKAVIESGHFLLGENRVQELQRKLELFQDHKDIRWHMIGHLQSNKYKYIAGKVRLIHSVDSFRLIDFLDTYSGRTGQAQEILLEFNISGETSKYGFDKDNIYQLMKTIPLKNNLKVKGLMTMAPYSSDYDLISGIFRSLKKISDQFMENNIPGYEGSLSMGMSNDYRAAIKEGSTIVRVGSRIFEK